VVTASEYPVELAESFSSVGQFDPVSVLLIAFVVFSKDFFKPMCLSGSDRLIHERGWVTDDELLAAGVAPQGTHFLKARSSFLSRLAFPYCQWFHLFHLLNVSDWTTFFRIHGICDKLQPFPRKRFPAIL
jgi:hypothetical protein